MNSRDHACDHCKLHMDVQNNHKVRRRSKRCVLCSANIDVMVRWVTIRGQHIEWREAIVIEYHAPCFIKQ